MGSRSSAILPCLKPKPPPDPSSRHQNSAIALDGPTYFLAIRSLSKRGTGNEEFGLTGASVDGKWTVASEGVIVRGFGHNDDRRWIDFVSCECILKLDV